MQNWKRMLVPSPVCQSKLQAGKAPIHQRMGMREDEENNRTTLTAFTRDRG